MENIKSSFSNIATLARPVLIGQPLLLGEVFFMEEIWKDIEGYDGVYKVSNLGRVISYNTYLRKTPMILKHIPNTYGYARVRLRYKGKGDMPLVHRLVAIAFIPNPENKPQVNHLNGIRSDARLCNLEWVDQHENAVHSFAVLGRKGSNYGKYGSTNNHAKRVNQYSLDGTFIKTWDALIEAHIALRVNRGKISECCRGNRNQTGGFKFQFA